MTTIFKEGEAMKKCLLKMVFKVTKTCNNGNEKTQEIAVYCEPFDEITGKYRTEEQRVEAATKVLKAEWYYNIEYVKTIIKYVLTA